MSDKSLMDQAKEAAGNAGKIFMHSCMLCVHSGFLICDAHVQATRYHRVQNP